MADTIKVANNSDDVFVEVDAIPVGYSNDGIFYKTVAGKHFKIANDGRIRAIKAGVLFDGTDQTSRINTILGNADVRELIFDGYDKSITVSGTVTVPSGKKLVFRNACKLIGSGTISGGIIECDVLKQCFATTLTVQNLQNNLVSICWFGAVADFNRGLAFSQTKTDNLTPITNALASVASLSSNAAINTKRKVYMPAGSTQMSAYYVSDTIEINTACDLYGDGIYATALIKDPAVVAPLMQTIYPYSTVPGITEGLWMHDFSLYGNTNASYGTTIDDDTSHGLLVNTPSSLFERLGFYYFNGDGMRIYGGSGDTPTTLANGNMVVQCKAYQNSGSGFRTQGYDGNKNTFINIEMYGNGRNGFAGFSALGDNIYSPMAHANGTENPYNRTAISYGGNRFLCKKDNVGIAPTITVAGTSDTYWYCYGAGGVDWAWQAFSGSNTYVAGAAYNLGGGAEGALGFNNSTLIGWYAEPDQLRLINYGTSIEIGGASGGAASFGSGQMWQEGGIFKMNGGLRVTEGDLDFNNVLRSNTYPLLKEFAGTLVRYYGGGAGLHQFFDGIHNQEINVWNAAGDQWMVIKKNGTVSQIYPSAGTMEVGTSGIDSSLKGNLFTPQVAQDNNLSFKVLAIDTSNNNKVYYQDNLGGARALNVQYTDVGNSGTGETDLMGVAIGGGQLANNGDRLEVEASFIYAANANSKTLKFKFGSYTSTWGSSEVTSSGGSVIVRATIIRTGATSQKILWHFDPMFGTHSLSSSSASETLSGTVNLIFTGQSGTASDDITQKSLTVTYFRAP